MPNYDEFDQREDVDPRDDRRESIVREARKRTAVPGMILIIFGLIGLLLQLGCLALSVSKPDLMYTSFKNYVESMPAGPDRDKTMKQIEDAKDDMMMDRPMNRGSYILGALLALLMVLGGAKMRQLRSYSMSLIGAICGIIPCAGCCVCAMPFGIWALVVLLNADVRRAFQMTAQSG